MRCPLLFSSRAATLLLGVFAFGACADATIQADRGWPGRGGDAGGSSAVRTASAPAAPAPVAQPDPRDRAPAQIRGIYLTAYAAGSKRRLPKLLALAERTEINAFVVDIKDERGIHHPSKVELALRISPDRGAAIRDLKALADTLKAHGIHPIARIVVFKDPLLSRAKPEWSIRRPDGSLWADKAGYTWVSAWDREVWDHNIRIAEEAARAGFPEIQFDYVRFPEPYKSLPTQVHRGAPAGAVRTDAIAAFLAEARPRLHALGATVTADVFGLAMNEATDVGIGQQWERLSPVADHILPMVYPSHYMSTHLRGVPRPNRMPYETVLGSVGMGVIRNQRLAAAGLRPARIIPWIQAFDAPWIDKSYKYGPEQAAAQIRAVHDLGLEDWIFWDPNCRYERIEAGLAKTTLPAARRWTPTPSMIATVDRFEREGIRAQRERVVAAARAPRAQGPRLPVATSVLPE